MGPPARPTPSLLARRSRSEARRIGDILRAETFGGVLLVAAAAATVSLLIDEVAFGAGCESDEHVTDAGGVPDVCATQN
jgi:NhaA family Na+:H+ antiporter